MSNQSFAGWEILNEAGYGKRTYAIELDGFLAYLCGVLDYLLARDLRRLNKPAPVLPQQPQSANDLSPEMVAEMEHLDELIDDICDGITNHKRRNAFGIVQLMDNHWLRWGSLYIHLEDAALVEGVKVGSVVLKGQEPIIDIRRGEIRAWLGKVKRAKVAASPEMRPFASEQTAPTGFIRTLSPAN